MILQQMNFDPRQIQNKIFYALNAEFERKIIDSAADALTKRQLAEVRAFEADGRRHSH